jgi:spermidine/putrescine transport system substrate-binding protein
MTRDEFERHYEALQRGRIDRRRFLHATGLGMASAVLAACAPQAGATPAPATPGGGSTPAPGGSVDPNADWTPPAGVDLGDTLYVTTWPNYHDPKTLDRFKELTGVTVELNPLGSNEEMLAKLLIGDTGWDVLVPTNYTFETYGSKGLLEPLDMAKLPHLDTSRYDSTLLAAAAYPAGSQTLYGFNKNWGTTGFTVNTTRVTKSMATWKAFFELAQEDYSGKVIIHDYQLTSIGNALAALGYSFNSVDPAELAKAEELLIAVKPHLFAITSDYQPPMRNGDAWVAMTWTNDAAQLVRDIPEIQYVIASDGGEIWSDFFGVVTGAPHREAAYAFLDYMAVPRVAALDAEFHGAPLVDSAAIALQPADVTGNPVTYPPKSQLTALEFGTAELLTNEDRAELWARVKAS